jgi:hypothetical protein
MPSQISGIAFTKVEPPDVIFLQSIVNRANSGATEAEFVNDTTIATFDGLVDLVRLTFDPVASGYSQTISDILARFKPANMPAPTA